VLITRFLTPDGVGEVQDFMPIGERLDGPRRERLIRRVLGVRGRMRFEFEFRRGLALGVSDTGRSASTEACCLRARVPGSRSGARPRSS
jgi:hypothetical protein